MLFVISNWLCLASAAKCEKTNTDSNASMIFPLIHNLAPHRNLYVQLEASDGLLVPKNK